MKWNFVASVVLVFFLLHAHSSDGEHSQHKKRSPIILVPGAGGSQLEAFLYRETVLQDFCPRRTTSWVNIWLNLKDLLTRNRQCLADNLKLQWNPYIKKMMNVPGVFIRTPHFGNTTGIEWLDPTSRAFGAYMFPLVESLRKRYGYVRGKTIRGAPYDFRYDPGSRSAFIYFKRLATLIEKTYWENKNEKVVLLAHSMGAPYVLHFLRGRTQQWKDKFIKSLVTLGGAYAGSQDRAIKSFISGRNVGLIPKEFGLRSFFRGLQRTFSGVAYLFPDKNFWKEDKVLVEAENTTYTIKDYDRIFKDIGYPLASEILRSVPPAWNPTPPGVKIHCFYGINVPTVEKLTYKKGDFPDNEPQQQNGNGDGTVNIQSLRACKRLPEVTVKEFDKVDHGEIIANQDMIKELDQVL